MARLIIICICSLYSLFFVFKANASQIILEYIPVRSDFSVVEGIDISGVKLGMNREDSISMLKNSGYRLDSYDYASYCAEKSNSFSKIVRACYDFGGFDKRLRSMKFNKGSDKIVVMFESSKENEFVISVSMNIAAKKEDTNFSRAFYALVQDRYGQPSVNGPLNHNFDSYCWARRNNVVYQGTDAEACDPRSDFGPTEVLVIERRSGNLVIELIDYRQQMYEVLTNPSRLNTRVDLLQKSLEEYIDSKISGDVQPKQDRSLPKF